jgi:hypothetical protein
MSTYPASLSWDIIVFPYGLSQAELNIRYTFNLFSALLARACVRAGNEQLECAPNVRE